MAGTKKQPDEELNSQKGFADPDASANPSAPNAKPVPIRPRRLRPPAPPSAESDAARAARRSDYADRLDLIWEHNAQAMMLADCTHANLKRTQGDYFVLQAWTGDLLAREVANAPRTLEKLEELTPAIAKLVKLGNVIAQLEKVMGAYAGDAKAPAPPLLSAESLPEPPGQAMTDADP